MIEYKKLDPDYILKFFPGSEQQIKSETVVYDEFLPHIVFGNIFNPLTVDLLMKEDYSVDPQLRRIFSMYEELASEGDSETKNLLQTTLLECLWDRKITYERALEIMGDNTRKIWEDINNYLNIPEK